MKHEVTYRRYSRGMTPIRPQRPLHGTEAICSCGWRHRFNEGKRAAVRAWKEHAALKPSDIIVGHVYSAKRKQVSLSGFLNDREVRWISVDRSEVQYDSPAPFVKIGAKLPTVSMERFLKGIVADVTDECPSDGEWRKE